MTDNERRKARGEKAFDTYANENFHGSENSALPIAGDLIADVLHATTGMGLNFDEVLAVARETYIGDLAEERG